METIVQVLLWNAAAALGLALFVYALGLFVRRPALLHMLWVVVLVKLVTPPLARVPLPLLAPEKHDSTPAVSAATAPRPMPTASPEISERPPGPEGAPPLQAPAALVRSTWNWTETAAVGWLFGAAVCFIVAAIRSMRFGALLRSAKDAPQEVQDQATGLAEIFGLRRAPRVAVVSALVSPLLWPLGCSLRIVLPELLLDRLNEAERRSLLAHELAHIARRDHWVRFLEVLVSCLYWWHPVVWWAKREIRRAEENCCDAWVVWALPGGAKSYGSALLDTIEFLGGEPRLSPALGSGMGNARSVKARLSRILDASTPRSLSLLGWLAFSVMAAAALPLLPSCAPSKAAPNVPRSQAFQGERVDIAPGDIEIREFVRFLADYSGLSVVVGTENRDIVKRTIHVAAPMKGVTADVVIAILQANGFVTAKRTLPDGAEVLSVEPTKELLELVTLQDKNDSRIRTVEEKLDRVLEELKALRSDSQDLKYKGKAYKQWIKELGDRDRKTSEDAREASRSNGKEAVPYLLDALRSHDWLLRRNATEALWDSIQWAGRAGVEALVARLKDDEPKVREAAAFGLRSPYASGFPAEGIGFVVDALKDEDAFVRSAAARILGWAILRSNSTKDEVRASLVGPLTRALQDQDKTVRVEAVIALSHLGDDGKASIAELKARLADEDDEVKFRAVFALKDLGVDVSADPAIPFLVGQLNSKNPAARSEAASGLVSLGASGKSLLPALIVALRDKDVSIAKWPNSGYWAAAALLRLSEGDRTQIPIAEVVDVLIAALDTDAWQGALELLGDLGPDAQAALPKIKEKAKNARDYVRIPAEEALRKIEAK